MKKTMLSMLLTVLLIEAFIFFETSNGSDSVTYGIIILFWFIIGLLIGGVLAAFEKTKTIGKGVLLGTSIVLIIGLSVCSLHKF